MKRRIIGISLLVALLATAITGGTLAYLTDTDNAENTMVLGNVKIEQNEWERDADGNLVAFTQEKDLYPAVNPSMQWGEALDLEAQLGANGGEQKMFVEPNAVDKLITVKNTGHNDIYVRTLVALERGSVTLERFDEILGINYYGAGWNIASVVDTTIDGVNYQVLEFVFKGRNGENGVLAAGDITQPSLVQVYLDAISTNDDCAAIDGTGNGYYDILALSQAVQAEGWSDSMTALDTAFGDVTAAAATEWFEALN